MKKFILVYFLSFLVVFSFVPILANAASTKTVAVKNTKVKNTTVVVKMTAQDFQFTPAVINAHVGDTVKITLTGKDNKHSFLLSALNVNVPVNPGETKTFSFKVTKKGTFTFRCGVPCGLGHRDMTGTLIVS